MTLGTIIIGCGCFAAGIVAGVLLADEDYLHSGDLKAAGLKVVECSKMIGSKLRGNEPEPPLTSHQTQTH